MSKSSKTHQSAFENHCNRKVSQGEALFYKAVLSIAESGKWFYPYDLRRQFPDLATSTLYRWLKKFRGWGLIYVERRADEDRFVYVLTDDCILHVEERLEALSVENEINKIY